jgi:uncharacterized protein YecT (DUF1311 family)
VLAFLDTEFTDFVKPDLISIAHPVFARALNRTYTQDWPPHHALVDARALRAGYRAWYADRDKDCLR